MRRLAVTLVVFLPCCAPYEPSPSAHVSEIEMSPAELHPVVRAIASEGWDGIKVDFTETRGSYVCKLTTRKKTTKGTETYRAQVHIDLYKPSGLFFRDLNQAAEALKRTIRNEPSNGVEVQGSYVMDSIPLKTIDHYDITSGRITR